MSRPQNQPLAHIEGIEDRFALHLRKWEHLPDDETEAECTRQVWEAAERIRAIHEAKIGAYREEESEGEDGDE